MGGTAGHLSHVWENREFTFNDIVRIMSDAATGKLENVVEKFDGMQVSFTYGISGLRFARNKSEMIKGGLSDDDLALKFADKPNVRDAFVSGHRVLSKACSMLSSFTRSAFVNGTVWYSTEIMCSTNPNVICYDQNVVAFHGFPTFVVSNGIVKTIDGSAGVALLKSSIDKMQAAASMLSWRIHAPEIANVQKLSDGTTLIKAIDQLHNVAMTAGCTMDDTIDAYIAKMLRSQLARAIIGLTPKAAEMIVSRCLEHSGCPTLTKIKVTIPKQMQTDVSAFVNSSPLLIKQIMEPIEVAVMQFTVELLRGMRSAFLADTSAEAARIRSAIDSAVDDVKATGDYRMLDVLRLQLSRLDAVGETHVGAEGVVFVYKGHAYKFTGCFGPVNQILGLIRYGR